MPGSRTSGFSEAEDYEAALREEGCCGLLVTGPDVFRTRLTQIALHGVRLCVAEEHLPRIALVAVPADVILVAVPSSRGPGPIWGGTRPGQREIVEILRQKSVQLQRLIEDAGQGEGDEAPDRAEKNAGHDRIREDGLRRLEVTRPREGSMASPFDRHRGERPQQQRVEHEHQRDRRQ